jgi:hypothetical protein
VFLVEQNGHQTLAASRWGYVLSKARVVAPNVVPGEVFSR